MPTTIVLETTFDVDPTRVYDAFLDAEEHAAMTGSAATSDPRVGGRFTAWDGYIEGSYVELEPGSRILARWRTTEFPETSPDSLLEIRLDSDGDGTRLTLVHSEIPEGQSDTYAQGWLDYYFDPMLAYFEEE